MDSASKDNQGDDLAQSNQISPGLQDYLAETGSQLVAQDLMEALVNGYSSEFPQIFYKGDIGLLKQKSVAVVGTRSPSPEGKARATKIASLLIEMNFAVMSGLAKGIDTVAHKTALSRQGKTIAVLGTPIHKIYPSENKPLADQIASSGLVLSTSLPHEEKGKYLFPRRNRLMALLSKATIIIEAGPTSGVVHQAAECLRQKRTLILLKSLVENKDLPWVAGFLKSGAKVLESPDQLQELLK